MSICLGLESATSFLVAAVWSSRDGLLAASSREVGRQHAVLVIPTIDEILQEAGVEREAITSIAAGAGPGSYTGLRVAGAVAQGLARALAVPLAGFDTLAALAAGVAKHDGDEAVALIDARRGNVYRGRYRKEGEEMVTLLAPAKVPRAEALVESAGAPVAEGIAPDPDFVARSALRGVTYRPCYL